MTTIFNSLGIGSINRKSGGIVNKDRCVPLLLQCNHSPQPFIPTIPLTVTITPPPTPPYTDTIAISGNGPISITANPIGGVSPYTYLWELVSGTGNFNNFISQTVIVLGNDPSLASPIGLVRVIVTDSECNTAIASVKLGWNFL
jgi:hypothetical protein